jgi:Zn-dependent protease with chaperone function
MIPEAVTQVAQAVPPVDADALPQTMPMAGVLVLMLIPLTAYALWGDYFERYIEALRTEKEPFEEMNELNRVRLNGLFAVLAEAVIFLGTGPTPTDPGLADPHSLSHVYSAIRGIFGIVTILSLMLLQARYERKVRGNEEKGAGRAQLTSAIKACGWSLLGGIVYLGVFGISMVVCTAPAAIFKFPPAVGVGLLLLGMATGVLAGLCASFGLAPFFVQKIFSAEKVTHPETVQAFDQMFDASQVSRPNYWMVGLKQYHAANAMVAGFRSGQGIFKPGLFISKSAIDALTIPELRAIVLHEVSHIQMGHLRKRFIFSSGLVICSSLFTGACVEIAQAVAPHSSALGMVGCVALFASFFVATRSLAEQTRYQEIQADVHSIERLGSNLEDLANALRKLDRANGTLPMRKEPAARLIAAGHPLTELRVKILQKYFENRDQKSHADQDKAA